MKNMVRSPDLVGPVIKPVNTSKRIPFGVPLPDRTEQSSYLFQPHSKINGERERESEGRAPPTHDWPSCLPLD